MLGFMAFLRKHKMAVAAALVAVGNLAAEAFGAYEGPIRALFRALAAAVGAAAVCVMVGCATPFVQGLNDTLDAYDDQVAELCPDQSRETCLEVVRAYNEAREAAGMAEGAARRASEARVKALRSIEHLRRVVGAVSE